MRLKCRLHTVDDTIRARHEFISALIQDFKRTQRVSQSPIRVPHIPSKPTDQVLPAWPQRRPVMEQRAF